MSPINLLTEEEKGRGKKTPENLTGKMIGLIKGKLSYYRSVT